MKKLMIPLMAMTFLISCGGGDTASKEKKPVEPTPAAEAPKDPAYEAGLALVAKNDCLTCHKVDEKLVGPSYREVAEKYAGATPEKITEVAGKIIKGGSGVWGTVMMTPHASLSQEDAETMVKYILALKK
ncbi:MAG: c-type cytochrome [Chitinophagaceae bacterium]|nr:c-type cytochrome [Chitinophagaceae bacterium]